MVSHPSSGRLPGSRLKSFLIDAMFRRLIPTILGLRYGWVDLLGWRLGHPSCRYTSSMTSGLFSICTTVLAEVMRLQHLGLRVDAIDVSRTFKPYKDAPGDDVSKVLFRMPATWQPDRPLAFDVWDVHRPFKTQNLAGLHAAAMTLFPPSDIVQARAEHLMESLGVVPEDTIACYYRGTDKGTEIDLAPVERYIGIIERIDAMCGTPRDIYLQTDTLRAQRALQARFGSRVKIWDALPASDGTVGIHLMDVTQEFGVSRQEMGINMLAAVLVLARCRHVITTSGNVGAWIAYYRGDARDLYQFGADGGMIEPDGVSTDETREAARRATVPLG